MEPWLLRVPKKGEDILADHFEGIKRAICEATIQPGSCTGVEVLRTPGGTSLAVQPPNNGSMGVVQSGGITARVGTTLGTGDVELYFADADGVATASGQIVSVYSISSTTGGIPEDTYVMVQQDANGDWYIWAVDCGN